jgi:putative mRNA 3-end processing factor
MSTLNVVKHGSGFLIEYGKTRLALDTGMKGETTLLSHSHADHIQGVRNASHVFGTAGTFDTWRARSGKPFRSKTVLKHGETFSQLDVDITSLNAGHVLGSSMFHIEFKGGPNVLYTGDFNNVDSLVHSAAKPINVDVLITEATYGAPQWVFPKREKTHSNIIEAARRALEEQRIVIFHAYSLGKAQEAIALLQDEAFQVISGNVSIDNVCKAYQKHGIELHHHNLGDILNFNLLEEGGVIVSSSIHHTMQKMLKILDIGSRGELENRVDSYSLSGWTLGKYTMKGFPLSAHSDFKGLIDFAASVEPRVAYCFTDNAMILSDHLRERGVQAVPLE